MESPGGVGIWHGELDSHHALVISQQSRHPEGLENFGLTHLNLGHSLFPCSSDGAGFHHFLFAVGYPGFVLHYFIEYHALLNIVSFRRDYCHTG